MKKLLVFVLMLSPAMLSAQTRSFLINRIDREDMNKIEAAVAKQGIVLQTEVSGDKALLNEPLQGAGKAFEIAGYVTETDKPLGGARIKLRHNDPNDTREISLSSDLLTYSDGSFYYPDITPGKYRAYIDPKQLALLHYSSSPEYIDFEVANKENGDFKQGLNFILKSSDKVVLNQLPLAGGKSFDIAMTTTVIKFNAGNLATIHGAITNLTTYSVQIIFNRTHLRLPQNWTSSVCFGQNCFSATTDSIPPENAFVLEPGVMGDFVLNIYDADPFMGEDSVVDYIRFTAVASDEGDTLAYILKGVLEAPSGVQDNQPKPASGSPKIMTIYPSPLVQGSSIKVKVSSPRESNLSYSIYDALGREVALGVTRQHIGLGDNTVSIGSLDGLGNGTYMLKFNFGDGSSDTHFFQVLK